MEKTKERSYDEELINAQEAAAWVQHDLEPLLLGKRIPGWHSSVDKRNIGEAEAVRILPVGADEETILQINDWTEWQVEMREVDAMDGAPPMVYTTSLTSFLEEQEILTIFSRHFKEVDMQYLSNVLFSRQNELIRRKEFDLAKIVIPSGWIM